MLDWDDLRFFLAITRAGSLSSAAKALHVTQSTVGRRLTSMQNSLGVRLLTRNDEGYTPTPAGEAILERVGRMEAEALSAERVVAGHDKRIGGVVRVASSQLLATYVLAPALASLHATTPAILVEALPLLSMSAVAQHDVDVSIQLGRCTNPDVAVRRLGAVAFGLYASVAYVARHGRPQPGDGYAGHHLLTLLDERETSLQAEWLGRNMRRGEAVLRADSHETLCAASVEGGGLAVLPRFRADAEPLLRRIVTPTEIPAADIWLSVHRENQDIARIRMIIDHVADAVRSRRSILEAETGTTAAG